jgi:chitodextrinase
MAQDNNNNEQQPSILVQVWDTSKYAVGSDDVNKDNVTPAALWTITLITAAVAGVAGYTYGYKHASQGEQPAPVIGYFAGDK